MREHFHVTWVRPENDSAAEGLRSTAAMLACALRRAGERVRFGINAIVHDATNIVVGAHLLDDGLAAGLPTSTIIFNTEPLVHGGPHVDALRPFVSRFRVWEYAARNLGPLRALGNRDVDLVEPGYLPEMCAVVQSRSKDVDALFYGQLSDHRRTVLAAIERRGHRVTWLHDVYGALRDAWIGRSHIVLNLHYRPGAPLELGRIVHLLANRCTVVAESDAPTDVDADLAPGIASATATGIPDLVTALLADADRRAALAERGYVAIRARDYAGTVRRALDRRTSG
jgi:hypothetical protein